MRRLIQWGICWWCVWRLLSWSPFLLSVVAAPIEMARGVVTAVELHNLSKLVLMRQQLDGAWPGEQAFGGLVANGMRSAIKDPRLDTWGRPYVYRRLPGGFELRSAGPDRWYYSADDLVLNWKE